MPVSFLTNEQAVQYGRFNQPPSPAQLARYFYLDVSDLYWIRRRTEPYLQMGLAIQMGTVRFLGTFLEQPLDVPDSVVVFTAEQLDLSDWSDLPRYAESEARFDHKKQIRARFGYKECSDPVEQFSLLRWLYTRARFTAESPTILFDLATAHLVEQKVLLPGVSTLERLVAQVRERVEERLWDALYRVLSQAQQKRLLRLLRKPQDSYYSRLELLRHPPTRQSSPALLGALERLEALRGLKVGHLDLSPIPPVRIRALARYAAVMPTATISKQKPKRKLATLLAFAQTYELMAMDDALDVLYALVTDIFAKAQREGQKNRLRTLKDLDAAALTLADAGEMLLNEEEYADDIVRVEAFRQISRAALLEAIGTVRNLTRPPDDHYQDEMVERYHHIRRFLPALLKTIDFEATPAGQAALDALHFLKRMEGHSDPNWTAAPLDGLRRGWQHLVQPNPTEVDKQAFTVWTLQRCYESLRRRDLFVNRSERWKDVRLDLLKDPEWARMRPQVCRTLDHSPSGAVEMERLTRQLDKTYRRVSNNLPVNTAVRIENETELIVTPIEKLEELPGLLEARDLVSDLLPWVDLPELVLEIATRTGFIDDFIPLDLGVSHNKELALSICAVLVAEACNVGLGPVSQEDVPALKLERLASVQQNYIRAETINKANIRLVDAQNLLPLAQIWGGGEVASADGLRFVVPVRSLNARPNSAYFGTGRGVTYFNFTSDQFTGFYGVVVPGTLRDSLYILEGLLEQLTSLQPREIMTDTASYSDVVFGLFWLLGYQFSPHLADIGGTRFWRIEPQADYGALNGLARNKINLSLVLENWDDLLRVAGSLQLGTVHASHLMRTLQGGNRASTLAKAIAEVGRIAKTLYLLNYIDDESYRRRILNQLTRGERRHRLARAIFHGQRGELRQRYREGQEDQLNALGFVTNAVVLWNTLYMNEAVHHLDQQRIAIPLTDLERLSPLAFAHINLVGRYTFTLTEQVAQGHLRSLRATKPADKIRKLFL